jgi:hypothetical protein
MQVKRLSLQKYSRNFSHILNLTFLREMFILNGVFMSNEFSPFPNCGLRITGNISSNRRSFSLNLHSLKLTFP